MRSKGRLPRRWRWKRIPPHLVPKKVLVKGPFVKASNGRRYQKARILELSQDERNRLELGTDQQLLEGEVASLLDEMICDLEYAEEQELEAKSQQATG